MILSRLLEILRAPVGKLAALVIAAGWFAIFWNIHPGWTRDIAYLASVLALSVAMVWFSDSLGGMEKSGPFRPLDRATPPGCLVILGWLTLVFVPGIVLIIRWEF